MHFGLELARDLHRGQLEQARRSREAQQVMKLRRAQRKKQRAERRLIRAWSRAQRLREELRAG